jgi:uncharacterized protein
VSDTYYLMLGAFFAAIASGMAGFAFALIASATFLHFREPADATPLVVAASLLSQSFAIWSLRAGIDWRRLAPFVIGGIAGIPLGIVLLGLVAADPLRKTIGAFLVVYALYMLLARPLAPIVRGGAALDGAVGIAGGALGGLAGLSGALPTIWAGLRGWPKDAQRAVYQPYIFVIQALTLLLLALDGAISEQAQTDFLFCLPVVALGVWIGLKLYARVDDRQFKRIVLALLLASGLGLVF